MLVRGENDATSGNELSTLLCLCPAARTHYQSSFASVISFFKACKRVWYTSSDSCVFSVILTSSEGVTESIRSKQSEARDWKQNMAAMVLHTQDHRKGLMNEFSLGGWHRTFAIRRPAQIQLIDCRREKSARSSCDHAGILRGGDVITNKSHPVKHV